MPDGQTRWAREVDYDAVEEPWARYTLKDGGGLRHRSTIARMFQMFDTDMAGGCGSPTVNENNEPVYYIESFQQMVYSP
jgi:hypothetical protein